MANLLVNIKLLKRLKKLGVEIVVKNKKVPVKEKSEVFIIHMVSVGDVPVDNVENRSC